MELFAQAANQPTQSDYKWHAIANPIWQGSAADIKQGLPFDLLSPYWQMLLLGDGAPTRHFQLLTKSPIVVDVIAMTEIGDDPDHAPIEIEAIPTSRTRRQIWLKREDTGEVLSHATSWWSTAKIAKHLHNPALPIWASLNQKNTELYRDLQGIYHGDCPGLAETFGHPGPYWGRHYLLWHGGQPLTLIYEIYSPAIAKYLGSSQV
ncbi:chorismate lyase [Thalassoporum mexicanum PCC 7367]|uniref:chorismate lyase n=1 Tax=Thalassoporum mexicanum TaxID=3457544 RepID=UPI00029F934D|nr:chorismate lyase [Pseudanabaena sp. PCC 7367]AFY70363.1 chorismate lyase [Pseudanabaena sp. PCC 7367]